MKAMHFFKPTRTKIVIVVIIAVITVIARAAWTPIMCDNTICSERFLEFLYPYLYGIPTLPAYIVFEGHWELINGIGWVINALIWYVFACILVWVVRKCRKRSH